MGTLPCFRLFFHFSNVLADVSDVFRKRVEIKALPMFEVLYGRPFWLCLFIFLMFYDCFQFACLFFYVLNVSHVFAKFFLNGLASHNQQRDRFELDSQNYIVQHILVLGLDCLGALQLEHFRLEGPYIIN